MSQFDSVLNAMRNEPLPARKQLLEYLLQVVQNLQRSKKVLKQEDKDALLEYAQSEVEAFLIAIPKAASYKEKDLIFDCEDILLGLVMAVCPSSGELPKEMLTKINTLMVMVGKERYIETALDNLFTQDPIGEAAAAQLLALVAETTDEYQKGKLYAGLAHYKDQTSKLTERAKARFSDHIAAEFKRYLALEQPGEDCVNNLELMADVCKYYANDEVISLLGDIMKLGYGNVNFYAVETLLATGYDVPADIITALAKDLGYANLTYAALEKFGKQSLFPAECATAEYLAKSDLVHWLMYPTELGKAPDAIEYIGKITYLFRKDVYYVFRFRSDSDTLDDKLKDKWLIGWSGNDGGTFSNFDEYALYEKETVAATLKYIKKKLIG